MPLVRRVVKLVGSGIGLAREAYVHNQRSKSQNDRSPDPQAESSNAAVGRDIRDRDLPPDYLDLPQDEADKLIAAGKAVPVDSKDEKGYLSPPEKGSARDDLSDNEEEDDEEEVLWELDDAAEHADPPSYEESEAALDRGVQEDQEGQDEAKLIREVLSKVGPVPYRIPKLAAPVVIPQRRPRSKGRGFVHAYAPVLANHGIDQDTFLTFTKNFSKAAQPSKGLVAVFVAAGIVGFTPSIAAMVVSTVAQFAAGTAIELQRRYRGNAYLNEMNQKLFQPRGLYALVISFKSNQDRPIELGEFDPNKTIAQYTQSTGSKFKDGARNLRVSSAKTYNELEIGETAPLVFPALDEAAKEPESNKFKRANDFLQGYYDRRAQAAYQANNPNSALAMQEPIEFASRYSDPNHPANSGSLIALITGGHVNPQRRRQDRRNLRRVARGKQPRDSNEPRSRIRRMLREDVLYLMVVNMPSEEELAVARRELEIMKQQSGSSSNSFMNFGRG